MANTIKNYATSSPHVVLAKKVINSPGKATQSCVPTASLWHTIILFINIKILKNIFFAKTIFFKNRFG